MTFCASARFPASPLPGFPASRLPGFPAFRLPRFPASCFPAFLLSCFPAFWLPSPFSPSLPPSPPSPPSLLLLCLRPLPEPPVFCPLWMEWRGRGPCPDAVWPLPAVFWGGLRGYPGFRPLSDGGCGKGSSAGPLMWAAARVRLSAGPGLWCEPRRGAYWRVGPRHGDGTAGHEKSTVPIVRGGAFILRFVGWDGRSFDNESKPFR